VIRINPNHAEAHFSLGITYMQQGRIDDAIAEARAAIRLGHGTAPRLLADLQTPKYRKR